MSKFVLEFDMDNDAFNDFDRSFEVRRILTRVRTQVEIHQADPGQEHPVVDVNGNTVGSWRIEEDA